MPESDSVLFNVDINNYNGPLDVLLDLAKAQKVDLEEISITKLADQFHDYITNEKELNLEIASEYLSNGYMVSLSKIQIIVTWNTRRRI
jgi:segregation and condensation protein A